LDRELLIESRQKSFVILEQTTIYRYGWLAWIWRVGISLFLIGGTFFLVVGQNAPWLLLGAAALLGPSLFFGAVVAVQADRQEDGELRIWTLLFWRRRIRPEQLGRSRLRNLYHGDHTQFYAPRLWVSVRGQMPVYFDLLGEIPNRKTFGETFHVRTSMLPGRD